MAKKATYLKTMLRNVGNLKQNREFFTNYVNLTLSFISLKVLAFTLSILKECFYYYYFYYYFETTLLNN